MLLIQFNRKNNLVLHPEVLKLTKYLKKVDPDQLRYIALAYDYKSIYRLYPKNDRKRMAVRNVWGADTSNPEEEDIKNGTDSVLLKAIEEYSSLQFDFKRDLCDKYITKIQMLQDTLLLESEPTKIEKIDKAIKVLETRIVDIQREIDKDETAEELRGSGELSMIETWQRNARSAKTSKNKNPGYAASDILTFDEDKYEDKE